MSQPNDPLNLSPSLPDWDVSRRWFLGTGSAAAAALLAANPAWAGIFGNKKKDREEEEELDEDAEEEKRYATKIDTPLIGEYTNFAGLAPIALEGVGIVVGLAGTGGDPAPSVWRSALLEDLKRHGVANPNEIIRSPSTALVLVRAFLPPVTEKGETIDVEVRIPESAAATSLEGGWLMPLTLAEQVIAGGMIRKGKALAKAAGPVMVGGIGQEGQASNTLKMRGRVLGGATVLGERELAVYLRNDFRSVRNTIRVAEAIGRRFHDYDKHGIKKPMADAKDDQKIVLSLHPKYKNNFARYLQVIRHIAFHETPVAMRVRLEKLKDALIVPQTTERAALQLEAIGTDAVPILKAGLKSPTLECRFNSAVALAYLGESDAIPTLLEVIKSERAFRIFALAAISTLDDAEAAIGLRTLMSEQSAETRYGSFRCLWTINKNDPFIKGKEIDVAGKSKYMLHALRTEGEPMVHTTLRTRPEVVVYGVEQELSTPCFLSAGKHVTITAASGAQSVSIARFEPNKPDQRREVPLRLIDVIRAASELGATYPDIVQMLSQADRQRNLAGRLYTDALPKSGRVYERPGQGDTPKQKARIGRENLAPNLFPHEDKDPAEKGAPPPGLEAAGTPSEATGSKSAGMASVPATSEKDDSSDRKRADAEKSSSWRFWRGNKK